VRAMKRAISAVFLLAIAATPRATESAVANGDTRMLVLENNHTNESGSFTYMVNGSYDMGVLEKLNWFLRDWRLNESTKMDPKLFDILWEVYRESGSSQPIDILSAYRSPQTNAMLRRRSRLVAEHSQHMEGRAVDAHFLDVSTSTIRDITMRMQSGGAGFYPIGSTPWVHIDSGTVRYWPRMSRDALTRLFPDGKTVFIPADGQPMQGYELARAEIEARGGSVVPAGSFNSSGGGLFAWLFGGPHGGGTDDAEESGDSSVVLAGGPAQRGRSGGAITTASPLNGVTEVAMSAPAATSTPKAQAPAPAATAETQPAAVADVDTETGVAGQSDVTLRGPIAAEFIAPLPPHKPQQLVDLALLVTPVPPARPPEFARVAPEPTAFAVASASSKRVDLEPPRPPEFVGAPTAVASPHDNRDLILALLKHGRLPDVITRGINKQLPHDALALADTYVPEPPDRKELIQKAAALAAPLPPTRSDLGVEKARPTHAKGGGSNPFGVINAEAFGKSAATADDSDKAKKAVTED
jgi:uncharacterized protein YcbK (DUF882 family)